MRTQPYERDWALHGSDIIDDTAAHTNGASGYYALQVVAATVVSAMTWAVPGNHDGSWVDLGTIPAGTELKGHFTSITLASGKVVAYRNAQP